MTNRFKTPQGAQAVADMYDSVRAEVAPHTEPLTVTTSHGATHILAAGKTEAPAVVLLHGSGATALSWADELTQLADAYRVYAIDLPGEPGTTTADRLPLQPGVHAAWLNDVLAALDVTDPTIVGESLGGWIALDWAATAKTGRVITVSTSGVGARRTAPLIVAGLLGLAGSGGREKTLRYLTGPHNSTAVPSPNAQATTKLALTTFEHFAPRTDALPQFSHDALAGITVPVHLIWGARDRMLDAKGGARRAEHVIPGARVDLLEGVGHRIPDRATQIAASLA